MTLRMMPEERARQLVDDYHAAPHELELHPIAARHIRDAEEEAWMRGYRQGRGDAGAAGLRLLSTIVLLAGLAAVALVALAVGGLLA